MTREEEIRKAAINYACDTDVPEEWGFIAGAKWADEHFLYLDKEITFPNKLGDKETLTIYELVEYYKISKLEQRGIGNPRYNLADIALLEHRISKLAIENEKIRNVNRCLIGELNRRWISVEENSIPIGRTFLARFEDGDYCLCVKYKADDGNFYVVAGQFKEDESKITHWMDIPPLPRKEELL